MHLEWSVDAHDGVTLVALQLTNAGTTRRVRVENRLDGPVWYPRRAGRPETGWSEDGFSGTVDAGATVALGYACPAPPREPPAELVTGDATEEGEAAPSAIDVLREFGDPRPPRDAVTEGADAAPAGVGNGLDGDWREPPR
jgi:hypothetical protein